MLFMLEEKAKTKPVGEAGTNLGDDPGDASRQKNPVLHETQSQSLPQGDGLESTSIPPDGQVQSVGVFKHRNPPRHGKFAHDLPCPSSHPVRRSDPISLISSGRHRISAAAHSRLSPGVNRAVCGYGFEGTWSADRLRPKLEQLRTSNRKVIFTRRVRSGALKMKEASEGKVGFTGRQTGEGISDSPRSDRHPRLESLFFRRYRRPR